MIRLLRFPATLMLATFIITGCSPSPSPTSESKATPANIATSSSPPKSAQAPPTARQPKSTDTSDVPPGRLAEDLTKTEPKYKMTAEQWTDEFKKDKKAAADKYKDAVIELSGTAFDSGASDPQSAGSTLVLNGADLRFVRCMMVEAEPWAKVAKGSTVKIKGKASGADAEALYGCAFVEVGQNPAIVVKAEDLAREFAANKDEAAKKYDGKPLIVDGEVVSSGPEERKFERVVLKGDGQTSLSCRFAVTHEKKPPMLTPGQRIKLAGEGVVSAKDKEPGVNQARLITGGK
jgi:hypothetical protein